MDTLDQLISGYTAYTDADEIGAVAAGDSLAFTPVTITTVSSVECAIFSVGVVTSASLTGTVAGGC